MENQLPLSAKTISASKVASIKDNNGAEIATYILTGTFRYDGTSSTCTNASCSTSVKNANWSFTKKTATASGNQV